MQALFVIKRATDGKFVFNLKATNGEVILTSQTYETKVSAVDGISSVKQNARADENYEERMGDDGRPYFVLYAANREVIGRSQMYSSREAMQKGIASVKETARNAGLVDTAGTQTA